MLIENGIAEAVQFFHLDALSSMIGLKVDFDLQITLLASSLYRLLGHPGSAGSISRRRRRSCSRNLLDVSATVEVLEDGGGGAAGQAGLHNPYLVASQLADEPTPMPWFGGKRLAIRFS